MQITCFQCRQQLDVPDDSAGKRVHCPHCSHVIVVPARQSGGPATALPSMELDAEVGTSATPDATKVTTTSVPPMPLPVVEPVPAKRPEPEDDLPPIERGPRRRPRAAPAPAKTGGAGKAMLIVGLVVALVVGLIVGAIAFNERPHRPIKPIAFNPPMQVQPMPFPQPQPPFQGQPFNPQPFMPNPPPPLLWREFHDDERHFKTQFPGPPVAKKMFFGQAEMTGFEAKQADWEFSVLHRALTKQQFLAAPAANHLNAIEHELTNVLGLRKEFEQANLPAGGPGREWQFFTPQGSRLYVRTFLIADGEHFHHYVLTAQESPQVQNAQFEKDTFFNAFVALFGIEPTNAHLGQVIYEENDDTVNGDRRDNEFLALAVHPTKAIAVSGTMSCDVCTARANQPHKLTLADGLPIEQVVISSEGKWLAVANGSTIHFWSTWEANVFPVERSTLPGRRCAITKDHRLLAATNNAVKAYDLATTKLETTLDINGMNVMGLVLAADGETLAVHDEKTIALWNWREKKLLGKIAAHDALITTVVFSPDGKTLASASADRTIKLWDVATRTERATLKQHAWTVWALAFTPDGTHLASGGLDGMLLIWDVQPEEPALIWAQAHQFPVRGVAFDAAGKHCYTTAKQALHIPLKAGQQYRRQVRKLAWSDIKPNPEQAAKIVAQCAGLHLPISNGPIFIARDGQTIATTSDAPQVDFNQFPAPPHTVRIWDAATARQRRATAALMSSVLSPDGRWLAFSGPGGNAALQIMEVSSKRVSRILWHADNNVLPFVFFAPDGAFLWVVAKNELIQFEMPKAKKGPNGNALEVVEKRRLSFKNPADLQQAVSATQSLDQKTFIVSAGVWDQSLWKRTLHAMEDGKELPWPKFGANERSTFLVTRRQHPDLIELVDALSGVTRVVGRQASWMQAGIIEPHAKLMVSGGSLPNRTVRITFWDLQEKRPLLTFPDISARGISRMSFSPDGRFFAYITNAGMSRVLPTDWLLERKELLACNANEVARP
jgi:WD40 repeat protein/DNA-directed RNA polymerase subunit RPC12/RpoP